MEQELVRPRVVCGVDLGTTKVVVAFRVGKSESPEILTFPPLVNMPLCRDCGELVATVNVVVSRSNKTVTYKVGSPTGNDTASFPMIKLSLDPSENAKSYNNRFREDLKALNNEVKQCGIAIPEITREKLIEELLRTVFERAREEMPGDPQLEIRFAYPAGWSSAIRDILRRLYMKVANSIFNQTSIMAIPEDEAKASIKWLFQEKQVMSIVIGVYPAD